MRVDFARADSRKMLQTTETTRALKTAHVNSRITKHLTRRTSKRARIQTVRQQIAIVGHDRHHRREVDVETQYPQCFAGDPAERAGRGEIAVLANRARGGHRRKDTSQAIDESAFLIDAEEQRSWHQFTNAVEQAAQLLCASDVAAEDDHAAGPHVRDQRARFRVEFRARKSDEEKLSDLLFAGK